MKEGSYEASLKAGEEVVKLGADHRIISLEWDKIPPTGKIHTLTRARRTTELLKLCTELDIKVLMFGHHQNDQTGNLQCTHCLIPKPHTWSGNETKVICDRAW